MLKRPTSLEQANDSVRSICCTEWKSAKSNVAYPGMVTDQEKQKEAYNLHLATNSLLVIWWKSQAPNHKFQTSSKSQVPIRHKKCFAKRIMIDTFFKSQILKVKS